MHRMWIFLGLVFLAVFLLAQGLAVPVFGENRRLRRRLRTRLASAGAGLSERQSLLREQYLTALTPFERRLESLPGMEALARLLEQSGRTMPAYRLVAAAAALAPAAATAAWMLSGIWYVAALAAGLGAAAPFFKVLRDRTRRMARFEEQFPEALDVIARALQAGHPLTNCLKLVSEDMGEPISREFERVFTEISYGSSLRAALLGLLERMPSVSVTAFVTAVLIQKETGGNLAETLGRITAVVRGRFRLYRRVRTLSAEGRLSAWILILLPLVLFVVIWITTPGYLQSLINDPRGPALITAACVIAGAGVLWIRWIIRIDV